jgi:putative FmdB family regulatory protein
MTPNDAIHSWYDRPLLSCQWLTGLHRLICVRAPLGRAEERHANLSIHCEQCEKTFERTETISEHEAAKLQCPKCGSKKVSVAFGLASGTSEISASTIRRRKAGPSRVVGSIPIARSNLPKGF